MIMIESDHDILIEIRIIQRELQKQFSNHLTHHFKYQVLAWSLILGSLVALLLK